MNDPAHPGVVTRVRAALHGERNAAALEALRVAGNGVYDELGQVERRRVQLLVDGGDLWTAPISVTGQLLAVWNAFVLQTLGAELLDADYAAHTGTVGYVPPATFDQVWSWFGTAADWLSQARQARSNPDYDAAAIFALPAALPAWMNSDPCPATHLRAMRSALPTICERAEVAVFDLDKQSQSEAHRRAVNTVRQLAAEAGAATDYATALGTSTAGTQLHELIESHLKRAITLWFHVGQLAAMPSLIGRYRAKDGPSKLDPQRLPGGSRFNPWCLTDPRTLAEWKSDRKARRAIRALWEADPDPARTLAIKDQIDAAVAAGSIAQVQGKEGSYYFCCPWAPVYQVRRRVKISDRTLSAPQQFSFEVSADNVASGGTFVRRIIVGPFLATNDVDY